MMMTPNQIQTTAAVVAALRPSWDEQGVRAALLKCTDRDPFDVTLAAVAAARDASNRTPAVIPLAGAHWPATAAPVASAEDRVRAQRERIEASQREAAAARESLLAARAACRRCDDAGRLPGGAWCTHREASP